MKVFIPYTKLSDATVISLIGYDADPVKVDGKYGYSQYFKDRWETGESFINVEHDCVIWPGAIEALEECQEPWCVYDYSLPNHRLRNLEEEVNGIPLGCMKISTETISKIPECWDEKIDWSYCDQHLTKYALKHRLRVHQHYPGIVNANKELVKLARR